MNAFCHPLPNQVAEEMLQVAARAMCDRPGENPAQRDSRTTQMVHSVLSLAPRDGLEYMLSILVAGHFNLILDSLREALGHEASGGQTEAAKARTKSTMVGLDRVFVGMIRELREERKRPLEKSAATARTGVQADVPAPRPEEVKARVAGNVTLTAENPATDNAAIIAEMARALREEAERTKSGAADTSPDPSRTRDRGADAVEVRRRPMPGVQPRAASGDGPGSSRPSESGGRSEAEELADFERALAVMTATLDEARAPDHSNGATKGSSGD